MSSCCNGSIKCVAVIFYVKLQKIKQLPLHILVFSVVPVFDSFELTKQRRHQVVLVNVLQDFADVGFAVLFFSGKVAQRLLPQATFMLPVAFARLYHFPILLILHVVVHYLLVPANMGVV